MQGLRAGKDAVRSVAQSIECSDGVGMCLIVKVDIQMTERNGAPGFSASKHHGSRRGADDD